MEDDLACEKCAEEQRDYWFSYFAAYGNPNPPRPDIRDLTPSERGKWGY
jgi:hypothetical protein